MSDNKCPHCAGSGLEPNTTIAGFPVRCTVCHGWRTDFTKCDHEWRFCCVGPDGSEHNTCSKCGASAWDGEVTREK